MIAMDGPPPLIADEGLRTRLSDRAAALFSDAQREMRACARFAVQTHPAAIDYIEQAPVLIVNVSAGGGAINGGPGNRHYAAHRFGKIVATGGRLRDVLARCGYPLPLRRLKSKALSIDHYDAIGAIARLPPAMVGQIIPSSIAAQRRWLGAVAAWRDQLRQMGVPSDRYAAWAISQMAVHAVTPTSAEEVADFVARGDAGINTAWQWPRAITEARAWHDRLSAGDAKARYGVTADQVIDHRPHPDLLHVDGYDFVALRTPAAIFAEGQYMRHCVASYVGLVTSGVASIVSMQRDDGHVATIELREGRVVQCKGRFNRAPHPRAIAVARSYEARLRILRQTKKVDVLAALRGGPT